MENYKNYSSFLNYFIEYFNKKKIYFNIYKIKLKYKTILYLYKIKDTDESILKIECENDIIISFYIKNGKNFDNSIEFLKSSNKSNIETLFLLINKRIEFIMKDKRITIVMSDEIFKKIEEEKKKHFNETGIDTSYNKLIIKIINQYFKKK